MMKVHENNRKWFNALEKSRISVGIEDIPHFSEEKLLDLCVFEERLVNRKSQSIKRIKLLFKESELLAGMTPRKAHANIIASPQKGEY